jgi:hypothetical protein
LTSSEAVELEETKSLIKHEYSLKKDIPVSKSAAEGIEDLDLL